MIQIERINGKIPKDVFAELTDDALREWKTAGILGPLFVKNSYRVWVLKDSNSIPLFIVGVWQPTLFGQAPKLWALRCKQLDVDKFQIRRMKALTSILLEKFPTLLIEFEPSGQKKQKRFASFFGFEKKQVRGTIEYWGAK